MGFPVTVVLGASGRIGTLLRHIWPQSPTRWQSRRALPCLGAASNITLLDPLAEPESLAALIAGAEVVLCLGGSIPGRGGDLADNSRLAEATIRAAKIAAQAEGARSVPRVLLASSAAVYGNQPGLLDEKSALCPANAYGQAKVEMEQRAQALGQRLDVPVTALRIGNIAGLDAILGGWKPGFILDQFPDGRSPRRSYIGPRTLAQVLARLVTLHDLPPQLNLAQPTAIEMAALLRAAGRDFDLRPAPKTAISEVALDVSQLLRILGDTSAKETDTAPADAAQMVAEWTILEPVMVKAQKQADTLNQTLPGQMPPDRTRSDKTKETPGS